MHKRAPGYTREDWKKLSDYVCDVAPRIGVRPHGKLSFDLFHDGEFFGLDAEGQREHVVYRLMFHLLDELRDDGSGSCEGPKPPMATEQFVSNACTLMAPEVAKFIPMPPLFSMSPAHTEQKTHPPLSIRTDTLAEELFA